MWVYPDFDPIAFHLGSWPVHWYGLSYLMGFLILRFVGVCAIRRQKLALTVAQWDDGLFYGLLAGIIGGRLFYMLVYNFENWCQNFWLLFYLWKGGMSFHGGLLGGLLGIMLYARRCHGSVWIWTDFVSCYLPVVLSMGRFANFINGELWGRVVQTDLPWAIIYPHVDLKLRHPSQLYEMMGEGLVLFVLMQVLWRFRRWQPGWLTLSFLASYGVVRTILESFREPDAQMGYYALGFTMGQILSLTMTVIVLLVMLYRFLKQGAVLVDASPMSEAREVSSQSNIIGKSKPEFEKSRSEES